MNTSGTLLLVAALGLGGCATVVKGTKQDIAVDTSPQGATCVVSRGGAEVAMIQQSPGVVQVGRDKEALVFSCTKAPEFAAAATQRVESSFNGATFGNIIAGGLIGVVVDASTGANYTYPEKVSIDLAGVSGAPVAAIAPAAPAAAAAPAAVAARAAPAAAAASAAPAATIRKEDGTITMKPVND